MCSKHQGYYQSNIKVSTMANSDQNKSENVTGAVVPEQDKNPPGKEKPFKFKVLKHVSLPILKVKIDEEFYIRPESPIYQGKELKNIKAQDGKLKQDPAWLMRVTHLTTGELCELVLNHVLRDTIQEDYPNESYVGRYFAVTKKEKASGKNYNPFIVTEIEPE